MAVINVLDKRIAELIAAGEVVERPASVIKELVENSVDAGARNVTVEIMTGGISFMRITDDGCGMTSDDLPRAFLRHATSKIKNVEDLDDIHTFGFRGEALASVAAVAHVEILTRTSDSDIGSRCEASDSVVGEVEEAGCPLGTTVVVRDLFYNTPARMKFLKKDVAEGNAVAGVMDKMALSYPEVRFRFIREGDTKLTTSGSGELENVISEVFGREFARNLVKVDYTPSTAKYLRLTGFITKPAACRTSRSAQNFFVNRRFIKTRTALAALEEAFKGSTMVGKYPGCVLNIEMPPEALDVNVHPAKIEVRFQNEKSIFDLVYYGVKSALGQGDVSAVSVAARTDQPSDSGPSTEKKSRLEMMVDMMKNTPSLLQQNNKSSLNMPFNGWKSTLPIRNNDNLNKYKVDEKSRHTIQYQVAEEAKKAADVGRELPPECIEAISVLKNAGAPIPIIDQPKKNIMLRELRFLGEAFGTYAVLEGRDELIFVDKHAAHERIIYEKLRAQKQKFDRQVLLTPVPVLLSDDECEALLENSKTLDSFGFSAEDFGRGTVLVREAPLWAEMSDIANIMGEISTALCECKNDVTPEKLENLYHSIACRAAIKAHDMTTGNELQELVEVIIDDDIRYCPHGRPVSISLKRDKIERLFGRQQ